MEHYEFGDRNSIAKPNDLDLGWHGLRRDLGGISISNLRDLQSSTRNLTWGAKIAGLRARSFHADYTYREKKIF